jgi:hypothetical protein
MHKPSVDQDGVLHCHKCGGESLLAKTNERNKRTKHLKCEDCGEHQRYREPKALTKTSPPSGGPAPARSPNSVERIDAATPPRARIVWRPPDA